MTPKKIKNYRSMFAPLSFLLICAALVFGMSVFFRVNQIEVTGNSRYTAEEIIEASGIEQGDNLFFINRGAATARINARLPYVENARIDRSLPNRLVIHVEESDALAAVQAADGSLWVIDRSCKLLAEADAGVLDELIYVEGLTAREPEVGQILDPGENDGPKADYLADILRQISELGMQGDVTRIELSNVASPSFDYLGRFSVKLGNDEDLEYKFQLLRSAVAKLSEGDRGTLDLSIDKRVHLTYD